MPGGVPSTGQTRGSSPSLDDSVPQLSPVPSSASLLLFNFILDLKEFREMMNCKFS